MTKKRLRKPKKLCKLKKIIHVGKIFFIHIKFQADKPINKSYPRYLHIYPRFMRISGFYKNQGFKLFFRFTYNFGIKRQKIHALIHTYPQFMLYNCEIALF